jgi:hypothetical protein
VRTGKSRDESRLNRLAACEWILDGVHVLWRRWDLGSAHALNEDAAAVRALYRIAPGTPLLVADGGFNAEAAKDVAVRFGPGLLLDSGDGTIDLFLAPPCRRTAVDCN